MGSAYLATSNQPGYPLPSQGKPKHYIGRSYSLGIRKKAFYLLSHWGSPVRQKNFFFFPSTGLRLLLPRSIRRDHSISSTFPNKALSHFGAIRLFPFWQLRFLGGKAQCFSNCWRPSSILFLIVSFFKRIQFQNGNRRGINCFGHRKLYVLVQRLCGLSAQRYSGILRQLWNEASFFIQSLIPLSAYWHPAVARYNNYRKV